MLVGFKRAIIQPLDLAGAPDGEVIIVEGKQSEGATQEATISGLSAEAVKAYGSNIAYYVSQKGTGDMSVSLKLLDMPSAAENRVLGYQTDEDTGAQFIGEKSEPPYCAVILESEDALGNVALFGFFKGKFSKGDIALKTKDGANFTPEGEAYTYSVVASDRTDKTKGNSMLKFIGTEERATIIKALVMNTGA